MLSTKRLRCLARFQRGSDDKIGPRSFDKLHSVPEIVLFRVHFPFMGVQGYGHPALAIYPIQLNVDATLSFAPVLELLQCGMSPNPIGKSDQLSPKPVRSAKMDADDRSPPRFGLQPFYQNPVHAIVITEGDPVQTLNSTSLLQEKIDRKVGLGYRKTHKVLAFIGGAASFRFLRFSFRS